MTHQPNGSKRRQDGMALLTMGTAFIALGAVQPVFFGIACAFMAVGAALIAKSRRDSAP